MPVAVMISILGRKVKTEVMENNAKPLSICVHELQVDITTLLQVCGEFVDISGIYHRCLAGCYAFWENL